MIISQGGKYVKHKTNIAKELFCIIYIHILFYYLKKLKIFLENVGIFTPVMAGRKK